MATWAERAKAPAKGEKTAKGNPVLQKDYAAGNSGLKLRVFASGKRIWFIRGRVRRAENAESAGAQRLVVLGEAPGMTREQAEVAAANTRDLLRRGIDPLEQRDANRRAAAIDSKTFGEVATEWMADRKSQWRGTTIEARRILFNAEKLKAWHDRPIASITRQELKRHAESIKPNSQQSQLGPLRSVFKYATEQGYIPRSTFTDAGVRVARSEGNAAPLVEFHEGRAPDFSELVAVLDAIDTCERSMPLSPWWNIWRAIILTGQRPSAVIGLRWSELALNGDSPLWKLPAERSKIKRESDVPLSQECAAILRSIPRGDSELVWPGRDGKKPLKYPEGETKMLNGMLTARGFARGWKPGRARDSVASWLEFQTDATERAMALLLGHKPPADNVRRQHYARISAGHQARVLIERWASAVRDARAGTRKKVASIRA
ncbi:MAG TPA: integrase arm-type DNA-binding domain-containing protein [Burkholderiales bacterium]|nr:integrase arm-type DNA-binding domain-containing protein [Burkholderiales bacterium]